MPAMQLETDGATKRRKTVAFVVVMVIMFCGTYWQNNKTVDRISRACVVAFMGTRVFLKNL